MKSNAVGSKSGSLRSQKITTAASESDKFGQWANATPGTDLEGEHTVSVNVTMPSNSWWTYARASKYRGASLGELSGKILGGMNVEFEEHGFRLPSEWEAHAQERFDRLKRSAAEKAS